MTPLGQSGFNGTFQASGHVMPILYTDFNEHHNDYPPWAVQGVWDLHVGQRVVLGEHGDVIRCEAIVTKPADPGPSSDGYRFCDVEIIPGTFSEFEEPLP